MPSSSVDLAPRRRRRSPPSAAQRRAVGVGEQREDGGEVRPGRARETETILLAGRDGCARAGGCDRGRTPPLARARRSRAGSAPPHRDRCSPARSATVPARRRHDDALALPLADSSAAWAYGSASPSARQVDPDDVVRRAGLQLGALRGVDHVVRRGHDRLQPTGLGEVVVECGERFDLCHRRSLRLLDRGRDLSHRRPRAGPAGGEFPSDPRANIRSG